MKEAMSSLSSSGTVVSVPLSASAPPSSGGCSKSVAGGSVCETGEKPLLSARLLASLLLFVGGKQSGIQVSICAEGLLLTFVARCGVARCLLRAVWSAVRCPDLGTIHDSLGTQVWDFFSTVDVFRSKAARAAALEDATHTSLRPGTAAVMKRSAGLDCVSVRPQVSVVTPGSASYSPPKTA